MDQRAIKDSDLGSRAGAGKRRSSSCFVFFSFLQDSFQEVFLHDIGVCLYVT